MRKFILFLIAICLLKVGFSQFNQSLVDSLEAELTKKESASDRYETLVQLASLTVYIDLNKSDKYGTDLIRVAEESRDRRLMTGAQYYNGFRYLSLATSAEYAQKAESFFTKALELAKNNKLDKLAAYVNIGFSQLSRIRSQQEKALVHCNQAAALNSQLKNDTLNIDIQLEYGNIYLQKREKILSLRSYLNALAKAEELDLRDKKEEAYNQLSNFYADIKDYDKAIDYTTKGIKDRMGKNTKSDQYARIVGFYYIGNLYTRKKEYAIAMDYFQNALKLADTLGYAPAKVFVYQGILNAQFEGDSPREALEMLQNNTTLTDFFKSVKAESHVDLVYAMTYTKIGSYDSAKYYFDKGEKELIQGSTPTMAYHYYAQRGLLHKKTRDYDQAIHFFSQAKEKAEQMKSIDLIKETCNELDTLFQIKGDYKKAHEYAALGFLYKDSLEVLSKEKELLQAEAADEQLRQERQVKEEAQKKQERHTIQYRIIVISIVGLLIALIMLGMFKVSAATIRMLAFFTFLLVFEFVFLLLKKQGHSLTEGEPWKDLLLMIALAAVLLPLHHWLEHKAISWLTSHNRLKTSGDTLRKKLFGRKEGAN